MTEDLKKLVEASRIKFSKAVREYRQHFGNYIDVAPKLPQVLLNRCKVFADRATLIDSYLINKNLVWAEVGVDKGDFSRKILDRCRPSMLHLIDIDTSRINMENFGCEIESGSVLIHEGDSSKVLSSFSEDYFDVVYIDGDHYYEGVVRDIEAAHKKVKANGLLIFNDYACWSPGFMYKCGVARAVNEYILETKCEVVALALQASGYYDLAVRVNKVI